MLIKMLYPTYHIIRKRAVLVQISSRVRRIVRIHEEQTYPSLWNLVQWRKAGASIHLEETGMKG